MRFPVIRTLTIRAKVIGLFALLTAIVVGASCLVIQRIDTIGQSVDRQQASIDRQLSATGRQAELIRQQRQLAQRARGVNVAQRQLEALQYWYSHAALNADPESLDKAHAADDALVDALDALVAAHSGLADRVAAMKKTLKEYRMLGDKMFSYFEDSMMLMGRSMGEAARDRAVTLTRQLEAIREDYRQQEQALGDGVLEAGDAVSAASGAVADSVAAIRSDVDRATGVSLGMMAAMAGVAVLFGGIFLRSVLRPIRALGRRIDQIQTHNDLTASLDYRRDDELQVISQAFDGMLARFRALISQLGLSTAELGDVATHGREGSGALTRQVDRQLQETSLVATATNQMTAAADGIQASTGEAARLAEEVSELTAQGGTAAEASVRAMESLTGRIDTASQVIHQLAERSDAIGTVLDVIREIAEQTNLLALNAAIEAARAGESGRGFAVVADEVRGLAGRTGDSTVEIRSLVENLQADARRAVAEIRDSLDESRETVEAIRRCRGSLMDIEAKAGQMQHINQQVAQATTEQGDAIQSIDRNLTNLTRQIEAINEHASETGRRTERLAAMGNELQGAVSQFRY
ncbi:methyl-accepting chemotaxis protein [Marinobacter sp. JSM 1782161]|uniref:methyl-accepting chemotaxis protein n=1 Tax=Marinobacter sp. JSM 1782161 TaxID=2685906 RepID=UPI00140363B6|nr:methyl-accepting chemotaxis protein [Marinobacter sp. JSM 1782161]